MSRREHVKATARQSDTPMLAKKQQLKERLAQFDAEIKGYEDEIKSIRALVALRKEERQGILKELESITPFAATSRNKAAAGIEYGREEFEWSRGLKAKMKSVFGINDFRLCQRGCVSTLPEVHLLMVNRVCNANMDGRDIVCVMPTGPFHLKFDELGGLILCRRGWKIVNVPSPRSPPTWVHTRHITSHFPHHGSNFTPSRSWR